MSGDHRTYHEAENGEPSRNPMDDASDFLERFVSPIIERINVDEFTTPEFIAAMQMDPPSRQAYEEAVSHFWKPNESEHAKMVIHGQVIPDLLRRSGQVEWMGFAHGEVDPYAVPAWWKKIKVVKSPPTT